MQEVTLIQKKICQGTTQYEICKEGINLLRSFKNKKLRIIFNISHERKSLNKFNNMLFNADNQQQYAQVKKNICLTISKYTKQLQGQRIIIIFNAYEEANEEPLMVLIGYLAASIFIYHHQNYQLSRDSYLTFFLSRLKHLLTLTNIQNLYKQMTYKKGYSKTPHFLCLLSQKYSNNSNDPFKQFYRYSQGANNQLNQAVDVLIDFLPERSSICIKMQKEQINKIGKEFQENVLGRQIFNFQFTGTTIENLCFQCCEAFNNSNKLDLNLIYLKIIENQKSRLEDQAYENYLKRISLVFFGGSKIDFNQLNQFPINNFNLLQKHNEIVENILDQTIKSAANCMDINQYKHLYFSLRNKFKKMFVQLSNANQLKTQQCCRQCFQLLQNLEECQINSQTANELFREINNKFQQFTYGCSETLGNDLSLSTFAKYSNRLKQNILNKISPNIVEALQNYQITIQQYRAERQQLKYDYRLLDNKLRQLQHKYRLQQYILNQYKLKLSPQTKAQQKYSLEINKFRRKIQELQQEVKDKNLYIEELEGIIQRCEIQGQRDKKKYKFSKEIIDMIKQVSNQVNTCHVFIRQAKKANQLHQQIKQGFLKERQSIIQQRKKATQQFSAKQAQFQKLIKQKTILQQVVNEARQGIQVYKQVEDSYKDSISNLEVTYAQAQCLLAQTQNQLQLFKKAISLISQQQQKGSKLQSLSKFYKVSTNSDLRQFLKPFLKK